MNTHAGRRTAHQADFSPLFLWTLHTELRPALMVGILTAEPSCPRPCNLFTPEYWCYRHTSPDTQQHLAPTIDHWLFSMFKCTSLLKHVSCIKDSGDYFLIFYFKETKRSWNEFQNKNKVGNGSRVFCVVGHCSALFGHTPGSELGLHIREGCFVPFSPKLSQTSWLLLVQALSPHSSPLGWPQSPALCAFPKQRQVDCN